MNATQATLIVISVVTFGVGLPLYCQQNNLTNEPCLVPSPETMKRRKQLSEEQEVRYRSPIRYAVVYNDISPAGVREIEIFMNPQNINERDLRTVFCWLGERYSSPTAMTINVHTNLNTIETPDERELLRDEGDSRFSKYFDKYKHADYHRYDGGREAFGYTISLSPFREHEVVIRESK